MMLKILLLTFTILINLSSNTLVIEDSKEDFYTFSMEIYEDKNRSLSLEEVKLKEFIPIQNSISLGYSYSNFWFRFKIKNNTNIPVTYILESTEVTAHELDFYSISGQSIQKIKKGMGRPNERGLIEIENPKFEISLNPSQTKEIYLKQYGLYPVFTTFRLLTQNSIHSNEITKNKYISFYLGAALILILYNFFIYVFTKSKPHILYVAYVLFFALWQAQTHGFYPFEYYSSTQNYYISGSLIPIWIAFVTLFTISLLETKKLFPKIYRVLKYVAMIMIILALYSWYDLRSAFFLISIIGTFLMPFLLYLGFKSYYNGKKVAVLYIMAQITFLLMSTIFSLMTEGYLPYNTFTRHGIVIGSFVEIFFFSLALGYKLKLLEEERFNLIQESEKNLQKKVEEKTQELQDAYVGFKTFFEHSSDGISILDLEKNQFIICNQRLVEILGCKSKDEIINHHPSELSPKFQPDGKNSYEKSNELIQYAIKNNGYQFEWIHLRCDGKEFWAEITLTPMKLNNKTVLHTIWRDISHKKRNEELVINQTKMAALGQMLGNISHQWRQPLSIISTSATGLKLQKELGGDITQEDLFSHCDMVDKNAQYLSKTIDDFKHYIDGDNKQVKFNLKDNIESFLQFIEGVSKSSNITIINNITQDLEINGYPNKLTQCYINIFNNSNEALAKVDDQKLFIISAKVTNGKVTISFKDNGGGIDQSIISKVFEPYFTTKFQSQGTGLGLYLVYDLIVNHMNGTIQAKNVSYDYDDKNYQGAESLITLPL